MMRASLGRMIQGISLYAGTDEKWLSFISHRGAHWASISNLLNLKQLAQEIS